MSNLPQGWVECEFENCIQKINPQNKVKQKEYLEEGLFPVIDQGQKLIGGYSNNADFVIKIMSPVVVFGDHTRCFKYIDFDFIAGADGIKILKPVSFLNEKLLYYFCQILKIPDKGYSRHYQYLSKTQMRIPPLNEQNRIVEKIEEEFEKIDEGIEKLKLVQEQIKQYKQSVLKYIFSDENHHIEKCEIRDIFKVVTGKTPSKKKPEYFGGEIPFVKPGDLDKNKYIYETFDDTLTNEGFLKAQFLPKDTVLISCIGNLGKKAILGVDGSCNQQINAIIPNEKVIPEYVYYYIDRIIPWMKKESSATTVTILNKNKFEQAPFLYTEKAEQIKIVEEIEKRFEAADKAEKIVAENLENAQQLKQSILKKAFEGRLVSQDPNDEPARV